MADPTPLEAPALRRVLGLWDATCVVVGAIIGVRIFFTPARTAALTRSGGLMLLAWGIGGGIALCGALTFAELGGMYHASGAQYQVLRDAYGPLPAFLFVFCNATAVQAVNDLVAVGCAQTLLKQGLKIPEDISVVGFGNILLSEYFRVPLTTVRQPKFRLGVAAMETMQDLLQGRRAEAGPAPPAKPGYPPAKRMRVGRGVWQSQS